MNRALCVGINLYPSSPLKGCVNDAYDWADEFRARGFETSVLLDAQASKREIMRILTNLVVAARSGEVVVFTFSGHGTWLPDEDGDERDGRDEALCPYDIQDGQLIIDDDLYETFCRKRNGSRVIFISDSCHSGTVSRLFGPLLSPPMIGQVVYRKVRYLPPSHFLSGRSLKAAERVMDTGLRAPQYGREVSLMISGCRDPEYSYDAFINGRYNGAFTRTALDALREVADGATYQHWRNAIRLPSEDFPQDPQLFGPTRMKRWPVFA